MTLLTDILDPDHLARDIELGYIREQSSTEFPYRILNYTEKAQFDNHWDDATLSCRGLIYNETTNEIVARPFPKFFNYSQLTNPPSPDTGLLSVTDKMDGCFLSATKLNLWGGGTIPIGKVVREKIPAVLVGMDEDGNLVPTTVTDWHDNGTKDNWIDLTVDCNVSRKAGNGAYTNKIRLTANHHVLINGEYRPALEAKPGDTVVTQSYSPSDEVTHLVRSSLLGDGCVVPSTTRPVQAKYQESHSTKQQEYVDEMRTALGDCGSTRINTISGYGSEMMWVGSSEYAVFGDLRREWYPEGVKVVPEDLTWMDDFAVAKWLMDDGCRSTTPLQRDRIVFSTNSFSWGDVTRLGEKLAEMYGVSYTVFEDRGTNLRINAGKKGTNALETLWARVSPYVHPSLRYKVPSQYQDVPYIPMPVGVEKIVPLETKVVSVSPVENTKLNFPFGRKGYDITTSTHNYMVKGVLVHNSLGIVYHSPDDTVHVATRGSFASDQALWATQWINNHDVYHYNPEGGRAVTLLVEIIYPENRIVLDYGTRESLVLLGAVEHATGRILDVSSVPESWWSGDRTESFPLGTLADVLEYPDRENSEGLVALTRNNQLIKFKQEDYVKLHRILTGLTERTIYDLLVSDSSIEDFIELIPDEFHEWVKRVAHEIKSNYESWLFHWDIEYKGVVAGLPEDFTQKDFALAVKDSPCRAALFLVHKNDTQRLEKLAWREVRPEAIMATSSSSS